MYRQAMQDWQKHLDFMLLDEWSLALAMLLAWHIGVLIGKPYSEEDLIGIGLMVLLIDFIVLIAFDSLRGVMSRGYLVELSATLRHELILIACVILALVVRSLQPQNSKFVYCASAILYFILSYSTRVLWKKLFRRYFSHKDDKRTLLIVTDTAHAPEIVERTRKYSFARHQITGVILIDRKDEKEVCGVPVVCDLSEAGNYICQSWVDEVFFFYVSLDERVEKLMNECREMALTIHLYVNIQGVEERKQTLEYLAGYEVLTANIFLIRPIDALLKRLMDIIAGLIGSILALLIMIVMGPPILIASPGPLLFKQERVGENGRKFRMYKIRSMYPDAEARKAALYKESSHGDEMMFKMDFDPRVIGNRILPDGRQVRGIGDYIRRSGLDEFPQFFNVLKGEMSLVGTRPPTLDEWEKYHYRHRARMSVRPGVTGLWQIREDKDYMSFEEVVRLDMDYISNWSLGRDFRIILSTIGRVMRNFLPKKESNFQKHN